MTEHVARIIEWIIIGFAIVAALILVFLGVTAFADERIPRGLGHTGHGAHWYDNSCCHNRDCEPVEPGAITMTKDGYRVRYLTSRGHIAEGFLPFGASGIRQSQDAQEHACAPFDKVICIYIPMNV